MDPVDDFLANDMPLDFSGPQWVLILTAAVLLRALPLLIAIAAIAKLRRFPDLRPLHTLLLIATLLVGALGLIDSTDLHQFIPTRLRTSGVWSFVWIFAIAWLAVTWTRSAVKTRLRPRTFDIATLICATTLVLSVSGAFLLPSMIAP